MRHFNSKDEDDKMEDEHENGKDEEVTLPADIPEGETNYIT